MREDRFRKRFGRAVRAAREAQGLTQHELAEAAEIADKYVSRLELGHATPSVLIASRIATALGTTVDSLAGNAVAESAELIEIRLLLRKRSNVERDLAVRLLRELFRPATA